LAETPSSTLSPQDRRGRPDWLAALLFGVLLLLALLIVSWFLRACAPVDPSLSFATIETPAPPAPPPPPDPRPALKASLDDAEAEQKRLQDALAAVQADLKNKVALCKPAEPPKPPPPPPPAVAKAPPPPPPVAKEPAPLPADRWAQRDLGMLQGCWRLGRDTQGTMGVGGGRTEMCAVKAGRLCFSADGRGERQTSANCPGTGTIRCAAPIAARFGNDNTLGTTQPAVRCNPAVTSWTGPPNNLTCRRVNDSLALCRDGMNFEYEFRRE
jgi:hypothetical protein